MDLYSIEKTKDYTFFKFVSWYYQLTPRTIKFVKLLIFMMYSGGLFLIYHFCKKQIISLLFYIIIMINSFFVIYILESLIKKLAKGTGNDRMIELCNAIKECNDCYLYFSFKKIYKFILCISILYFLSLICLNNKYEEIIEYYLDKKIITFYIILSFILGCFIHSGLYYFNLWVNSIALTRASSHSIQSYNEYIKFCYNISFTISLVTISIHIILLCIIFLIIYLSFYLNNYEYYTYPFDKIFFFFIPYLSGISLINFCLLCIGIFYCRTSITCSELIEKIDPLYLSEVNSGTNYKNPIIVSSLIKENIMNTIYNMNNILVFLINILIFIIIISSISDKKQNFKKISFILFPFLIITIENGIDIIRNCAIKTKEINKKENEFYEIENIILIYKKGKNLEKIIKILSFFIISFFCFNLTIFENIKLNEPKSNNILGGNFFWFNSGICYVIGQLIVIFLEYFSKIYLDISSPSIKTILTNSQEEGIISNIICSIINGIESEFFPIILIIITLFGVYNLGFQLVFFKTNLSNEIGMFFICFCIFGTQSDFLFINSINGAKTLLYLSHIIVKSSLYNDNIQLICQNCYLNINIFQNHTNNIITGKNFLTFFMCVNCIKFVYLSLSNNKSIYDIKIDLLQIENFIIFLFGFLFLKVICSIFLNSTIQTSRTTVKKLNTIYTTTQNNLIERTKIDYQQYAGIITQISVKEIKKSFWFIISFPLIICLISSFLEYKILQKRKVTIQSLISFSYSIISFFLIQKYYFSNFSNSLLNTFYLSQNIKNSYEKKNSMEIIKIGSNLGNIFQDTINISIENIILFILLLYIILISYI